MRKRSYWVSQDCIRNCPVCGSNGHVRISDRMQHRLNLPTVLCSTCSCVFTNPMPHRSKYERFYVEAYADYYHEISPAPAGSLQTKEPKPIADKLDRIEQFIPLRGKRLLEVGPGNGLFLYWARERGCDVLGVEPSVDFCETLTKHNIPHLNRSFLEVSPEEAGRVNLIAMYHVFEHFYDPSEALEHCRAILPSGGLLTIEVPNILKPYRSLDSFFLRYVHPSSFSPRTLRAMLERHGFQIQSQEEGDNDWRTPQNISVIASKERRGNSVFWIPEDEPDLVRRELNEYRRLWKSRLMYRWMLRDMCVAQRRRAIKTSRFVSKVCRKLRLTRLSDRIFRMCRN